MNSSLYRKHGHCNGQFLKINSRNFEVVEVGYEGYLNIKDTSVCSCMIDAGTIVKNEWISFRFSCAKKDTVGFMNRMIASLKTIQIDTVQ